MIKRLCASVVAAALVSLGAAGIAVAGDEPDRTVLEHSGQGLNDDDTCETVLTDDDVPEGQQIWHFVLTGQSEPAGATMSASFSDGTTVTDLGPDSTPGQTAHFFVTTDEGATLVPASASFDADQAGANPQFVVSNCVVRDGNGNGDNGNGEDENGNGENGNGENGENGNGEDENGDRPTPAPVPTEVPAGVDNSGAGVGAAGLFAGAAALVAAAWVAGRRFLRAG